MIRDPEETDSLPGSTPQPQVEVIEIFSSDEDMYVLHTLYLFKSLTSGTDKVINQMLRMTLS